MPVMNAFDSVWLACKLIVETLPAPAPYGKTRAKPGAAVVVTLMLPNTASPKNTKSVRSRWIVCPSRRRPVLSRVVDEGLTIRSRPAAAGVDDPLQDDRHDPVRVAVWCARSRRVASP